MKLNYNHQTIEAKWRQEWERSGFYRIDIKHAKKPYYNLMMYPYPSAEGLHVGNMYAFTGSDIWGRYTRMCGYNVFEPMGVDSGGIHSENFAIKMGVHPKEMTKRNISNFVKQLREIGNMFDWDHFVDVMRPEYYRWTQWIFCELFKAGLAEKKESLVTWCPACKTTLSDEQTELKSDKTVCERCKNEVEKRRMKQWFFKITKYADRLLNNVEKLDWSDKVRIAQRNWIGKSEGINIDYEAALMAKHLYGDSHNGKKPQGLHLAVSQVESPGVGADQALKANPVITCFTTRPDTNFGATFIVLAPEHPFVTALLSSKFKIQSSKFKEIKQYVKTAKAKSEQDRIAEGREKTGVFTGFYAINNLNGKKLPIWVSDFVLGHVGTGAVVGVPGHDKRDFEFAGKYGIEIIRVVVASDNDKSPISKIEQVQEDEGTMINSGFLNGMEIHLAKQAIMDFFEKKGWGRRTSSYHLRDWCISRQRYWGPPIPMVYCEACAKKGVFFQQGQSLLAGTDPAMAGWWPVPEKDLPVLLPDIDDYLPDGSGKAPLARHPEFYQTTCPHCGGPAQRETDVSDTFLDSSWYFLRYPSVGLKPRGLHLAESQVGSPGVNAESSPWDPQITRRWLPVDKYIGGAEHSVLHLLYSRFITMAMYDLGYLDFSAKGGLADEPFTSFYAHGLIIKDGAKMSKSKGNVVNPDDYIAKYGADALRCYLMFLGPLSQGGDFRDSGMRGMKKFLDRVWQLVTKVSMAKTPGVARRESPGVNADKTAVSADSPLFHRHRTIKRVTEGIKRYKYNTSIAALMEYVNFLENKTRKTENGIKPRGLHPAESQVESPGVSADSALISFADIQTLLLLLAPFAPYLTEELWQNVWQKNPANIQSTKLLNFDTLKPFLSIHTQPWPAYDEKYLKQDEIEIVIQINGKKRSAIQVGSQDVNDKEKIISLAKKSSKIQAYIKGQTIKREIYIPGKLVNLVV